MTQKYEPVVQEDLNVGTGMTFVGAPLGGELRATQVGLHSVARGQKAYEATWTPGAILTTGKASTTVTVPDAATGDLVLASHDQMLTSDLRIVAHVSAADTVTVVVHNPTASTVTVAAGTVSVIVFPFIGVDTDPPVAPDPPVAEFSGVAEASGIVGSGVGAFTDASTGGTPPYTYSWDFGDDDPGDTSTDQNPSYTYDDSVDPGAISHIFTVTLTITDALLQTDDVTHDIEIFFDQPV